MIVCEEPKNTIIRVDRKIIITKLIELNKVLYFSIAKPLVKSQMNPPIAVIGMKSCKTIENKKENIYGMNEGMKVNHGYDIDGIISPISRENIGITIQGDFKLDRSCSNEYRKREIYEKDYHFYYGKKLVPLKSCQKKYIGYFILPGIGDLKLYIIFPRILKEVEIRNQAIWETILSLKRNKNDGGDPALKRTHISMRILINEALKTAEGLISHDLISYFF